MIYVRFIDLAPKSCQHKVIINVFTYPASTIKPFIPFNYAFMKISSVIPQTMLFVSDFDSSVLRNEWDGSNRIRTERLLDMIALVIPAD
jgi:hypothetical protein